MDVEDQSTAALFTAPLRWGWEYVEPVARPQSELGPCPEWQEPGVSHRAWELQASVENYKVHARWRIAAVVAPGLIAFWTLASGAFVGLIFLLLGAAAAWLLLWPWVKDWVELKHEKRAHQQAKKMAETSHKGARRQWQADLSTWDERERVRVAGSNSWFPIVQSAHSTRVEVFGGTAAGWSALLTTYGASVLAGGGSLLVLDSSEQRVADSLLRVAHGSGRSTRTCSLPEHLGRLDHLSGFSSAEVADLLAEAVHAMRGGAEDVSLRLLDAQLLRKAGDRLGADITVARLLAALDALLHVADPRASGPLHMDELAALSEEGDLLGRVERVQNELLYLRSSLELLVSDAPGAYTRPEVMDAAAPTSGLRTDGAREQGPASLGWWLDDGLAVVATDDDSQRRKELIDHVFVQVLLRRLRAEGKHPERTLIVVGADHLGQRVLESLRRRVHAADMRCVLLFEHLRGDAQQLLGTSGSTSIIMRLGNAAEAASAAEFIGRGHRFRLSQLSRQRGDTTTTGSSTGTSTSVTETDTHTTGESFTSGRSMNGGGGLGVGTSGINLNVSSPLGLSSSETSTSSTARSVGVSRSRQHSQNQSSAHSQTDGVVVAVSYDFTVEPTHIQSMQETAFLLVETEPSGHRRPVAGDCDPRVANLKGVDSAPRVTRH